MPPYVQKKHRNPLEFHKASAPEPSGTSQGICTGTLRNRTAPEPSGTSPPEHCPEPGVEAAPDRTGANLG